MPSQPGQTQKGHRPGPRFYWRCRAALWLLLALGWALAGGCVQDGVPEKSTAGAVAGSWVYDSGPGCAQSLVLGPDGGMTHQVLLELDGAALTATVPGQWYGADTAASAPDAATFVTPERGAPAYRLLYCHQWLDAPQTALPFPGIAVATGVDPAALSWRALPVAGLGRLLVGSDGADHDRFALHLDGSGVLHGFLTTAPADPPLYHRTPSELVYNAPPTLIHPFLHLPEQFLGETLNAASPGQFLAYRLLRINTASDVRFGKTPGSSDPACLFKLYEDAAFNTPAAVNPLNAANLADPLALNPADSGQWFLSGTITLDGAPEPVHLWPVAIIAPAAGACSANIRARPIVARLLETHLALAPPDAPLRMTVGTGAAYLAGTRPGAPGVWTAVPLGGRGTLPEGLRLQPRLFKPPLAGAAPPAALQDILGLYGKDAAAGYLTLDGQDAGARLHLYADRGATYGLGPFTPYNPPMPFSELIPPTALAQSFAPGETRRHYRLILATETRIAMFSSGGLDTAATLRGPQGLVLAWDTQGAADGVGFHIVRTLPAGAYTLTVLREDVNGDFQLNVQVEPPGALVDERLEACLIAAGALRTAPELVRRVDCGGKGVSDAGGIATYPNLTHLDLSDNALTDLTPLAGLSRLHTLALGHNPVSSLAPLAALTSLRRLSLAGSALDATRIAELAALGDRLTRLELPGATGLTEAEAVTLKQSLPNTTLVTPARAVLD